MSKLLQAKVLSIIVSVIGAIVFASWVFDITFFKSTLAIFEPIKAGVSLMFVLSGITIYFIANDIGINSSSSLFALSASSLILFLSVLTIIASQFFGVDMGLEGFGNVFLKGSQNMVEVAQQNLPSWGTIIMFLFIVLSAVVYFAISIKSRIILKISGMIIVVIGSLSVIGHITNIPSLYFYLVGTSSGVTFFIGLLSILSGYSLYLASSVERTTSNS